MHFVNNGKFYELSYLPRFRGNFDVVGVISFQEALEQYQTRAISLIAIGSTWMRISAETFGFVWAGSPVSGLITTRWKPHRDMSDLRPTCTTAQSNSSI